MDTSCFTKLVGKKYLKNFMFPLRVPAKLVQTHWAFFVFALAVGLATVLPQILYIVSTDDFQGILNVYSQEDAKHYFARVKDIIDGHPALGNAYLYEHKGKPPMQFFLPEWILAQPLKLLNTDVPYGFLVYGFLLPFLVTLLVYGCAFLLTKSRAAALVTTVFLMGGLFLHIIGRPISPQFVFLFWLSQFAILLMVLRNLLPRKIGVGMAAFNFGLLFYLYPYYWTFYAVLFCLLIGLFFLFRLQEYGKKVLAILGIGLIVGLPYFFFVIQASQFPEYGETMIRSGLIYSRFPSGIKIIVPCAALIFLYTYLIFRRKLSISPISLLMLAGLAANIIVVNQHLITGMNIQFASHYAMGAIFWAVFSILFLWKAVFLRDTTKELVTIGASIAAFLMVSIVLLWFMRANFFNYAEMLARNKGMGLQRYTPILNWLNTHTEKDEVVYADSAVSLSYIIPIYTHNNVLYNPYMNFYLLSNEEIYERFTLQRFFENIDEDFVQANLTSIYADSYDEKYAHTLQENKVRRMFGFKEKSAEQLPQDAIDEYLSIARSVKEKGFIQGLKKYNVHYIVWDKEVDLNWSLDEYGINEPLYQGNNIYVYKL